MLNELRERARRWLIGTKTCHTVIIGQPYTPGRPPDAVGFTSAEKTHLIICITDYEAWESIRTTLQERTDYRIGTSRYILTYPGVIGHSEVPIEWGLLEAGRHRVESVSPPTVMTRNSTLTLNENRLMLSVLKKYVSITKQDPDHFFESGYAAYAKEKEARDIEEAKELRLKNAKSAEAKATRKVNKEAKEKAKQDEKKEKQFAADKKKDKEALIASKKKLAKQRIADKIAAKDLKATQAKINKENKASRKKAKAKDAQAI